jgi:outer membrane protein assembly factor BamB
MKTPAILAVSLSVVFAVALAQEPATPKAAEAAKPAAPEEVDILDDYKRINGEEFPKPPTEFRKGSVKAKSFPKDGVKKTDAGFEISMPHHTPVPTPTVYKGKLFASGGFSSKEYYCFDAKSGKLIWGVELDDDGPTTCGVEDDTVVFNTESCTIFAVEAETGKLRWAHWLGDPLLSTPTVSGGIVFTSYPCRMGAAGGRNAAQQQVVPNKPKAKEPKEGKAIPELPKTISNVTHALAAIDLKSGKILWQHWLDSDVMSAPVAAEGKLFVATLGGNVYSFNPADGEILTAKKSRATSAPVVVGKDVFMTKRTDGKAEGAKEALAKADVAFKEKTTHSLEKTADYLNEKVQAGSALSAKGKTLDAGNGFSGGAPATANADAAKWNVGQASVATLQSYQGSRALCYGAWNFNCLGDELVCTNNGTGAKQWSIKLEGDLKKEGGFLAAPPAAAGGNVFLATLKGEVLQVAPAKGEILKRYAIGAPTRWQPVIEGGFLYTSTETGKLICQDTGDPKNTGWSTWGGDSARTGARRMESFGKSEVREK